MTLLQICCELKNPVQFCTILPESTCVLSKFVIQYPCSKGSSFLLEYAATRWLRVAVFFIISATIARRNSVASPVVLYRTGLIKSILFLIFFKIAIDKINNCAIMCTVVDKTIYERRRYHDKRSSAGRCH